MPNTFLTCYFQDTPVYEVSLENGVVIPTLTGNNPTFDSIELVDPATSVTLRTGVIPSTVADSDFWKSFQFDVRCLPQADAGLTEDYSASVQIQLKNKRGTIVVTGYGIKPIGSSATTSAGQDVTISELASLDLPVALTPLHNIAILDPLGLALQTSNLTLHCSWVTASNDRASGWFFQAAIPLASSKTQQLTAWGVEFSADDLPASTITMVQSQRVDGSPLGFTSLDVRLPASAVFENWTRLVQTLYFDALNTVRDGLPLSFLPTFSGGDNIDFVFRFNVIEPVVSHRARGAASGRAEFVLRDPCRAMDHRFNIVALQATPVGVLSNCTATFPNLLQTDDMPLAVTCRLANGPAVAKPVGFCFTLLHTPQPLGPAAPGISRTRMGALELGFPATSGNADIPELTAGTVQLSFRTARDIAHDDDLPVKIRLENLHLRLGIATLGVGAQDDIPGEEFVPENTPYQGCGGAASGRRAATLQIPLQDFTFTGKWFVLDAHETCYEQRSQTLDLRIEQSTAGNDDSLNVVVIDPEPFFIARVTVKDYQKWLLDAVTTQIASWTNRGIATGWQFVSGSGTFDLILPPQGLGEAMHKRKGLGDVTPGSPADFRLTPPATFELFSSPVSTATANGQSLTTLTQRFADAPWNLRRVLGYAGQAAPGAPLNSAGFELVYGMAGQFHNRPGLRLAELGSRLGNLPVAMPDSPAWPSTDAQTQAFANERSYWNLLEPALRTRLAVLEPWDAASPFGLSLTQENDNLSFILRSAADLAYPTDPGDKPIPAEIPQRDGGLKGSFSWAFESDRIYRAVWTKPVSAGARISGMAFSSLGGWGRSTARYDNDRTGITTSVRMGRVESITVERIGRIGNFWNRARHVITYQRTVAATRQFYLEQESFLGLPILRKTEEHVELLQKRRDCDPSTDHTGAFRACEFAGGDSPRIPVDSLWGSDVGTFGYIIPLWRPGALPLDVYVKPQVDFHLETSRGDNSTARGAVQDPEKLCFYTTTDPGLNSDTDRWPKEREVDYGVTSKTAFDPPPSDFAAQGPDAGAYKPTEEPWAALGMSAFTYHLAPAPISTNIVSGVAAQAVGAGLRTITVMRGLEKSAVVDATTLRGGAASLGDHISNLLRPVVAQIPAGGATADIQKALTYGATKYLAKISEAQTALTNFGTDVNAIPAGANQICAAIAKRLTQQLSVLEQVIRTEIAAVCSEALHFIDGLKAAGDLPAINARQAILDQWALVRAQLDHLIRFGRSQWLGAIGTATDVLTGLDARLAALSTNAAANLDTAKKAVGAARDTVTNGLDAASAAVKNQLPSLGAAPGSDPVSKAIADVRSAVQTAAANALTALNGADAGAAFAAARGIIQAAAAQVKQFAADPVVASILTALGTLNVETNLDEIGLRLADAADWAAFSANTRIHDLLYTVDSIIDSHLEQLRARVSALATAICAAVAKVADLCTALSGRIADLQGFLASLTPDGNAAKAIEGRLHEVEQDLRQMLTAALPQLPALPPLPASAGTAMALLRGFGDVPVVPQMDFGALNFSAYRFAGFDGNLPTVLPKVNLTPLVAAAQGFAGGLNDLLPINLKVPSFELSDRLIPAGLQNFDWRTLVPNVAGLDLGNLFQGLRPPFESNDQVKVTHGLDSQTRSGWVEIDMDVPFGSQPAQVFSAFGSTLVLRNARFVASTRLEAGVGRAPTRSFRGVVSGDWDLTVAGYPVVLMADSSLTFDDSGHFGFDIRPDRVKLQAALEFLADLLSTFLSGDGFSTSITPAGLRTVLDLPLPDVQSGAFGIANLRLGFVFSLTINPFRIGVGVTLARPERPFTLTIFILGGAGYFSMDLGYEPGTGNLSARLDIGIFASASLAISLGPISGGIYAYFGITVAYSVSTGAASNLQIAIVLMFIGQVSLLGIINVSLVLSLSAQYQSGGKLTGRGHVSFSISIGPFFSINCSADVSYTYSNSPGRIIPPQDYLDAAGEYLAMFGN